MRNILVFGFLLTSLGACEKPASKPLRTIGGQLQGAASASTPITLTQAPYWIIKSLTVAHLKRPESDQTIIRQTKRALLFVPFQEAATLLAGNTLGGYRQLVLTWANDNQLAGIVAGILAQQTKGTGIQSILLARSAFEHLQNTFWGFFADLTGLLLYYTASEDVCLSLKHGPTMECAARSGLENAASVSAPILYQYCPAWYSAGVGPCITTTCQFSYAHVERQPLAGGWEGIWRMASRNTGDSRTGGTSTERNFAPTSSSSYPLSATASVAQQASGLADYGTIISTTYDNTSKLHLRIEIDTKKHDIKKLALTMTNLVSPVTFSQKGNGVFQRYDATTNRYYFSVSFQINGRPNIMYNGPFQTLSGWIDLDNNTARTRISVVP